jgi:hypothetical protein
LLAFLALFALLGCATDTAMAAAQLAIFLVAEPGSAADPKLFERTFVASPWSREELAIARTPSIQMPTAQIVAATVERRQTGQSPSPQVQQAIEALKEKGMVAESTTRYFALQLRIESDAARMLREFTGANIGRRVDIRLDGKRLSVVSIRQPVGESLMIFLNETDEARVKSLLSPIVDRLSWK